MLPTPRVARLARLDWRSASIFLAFDPDWRRKVFIGGLLLLLPPLGWPVALGYRKALIGRLATRARPVLPEWRGNVGRYWLDGMRAVGVMLAYYSPLLLFFLWRVCFTCDVDHIPWGRVALLFGCFFMLVPFLLPTLFVLSSELFGGAAFTTGELAGVFAAFALTTFVVPAAFMQVSRHGSYWHSLRADRALRLIVRNPRLYLEAWIYSGMTSLLGHFCVPFSPWGVFWCYQSIVFSFNEIRMHTNDPEDRELQAGDSWYAAFRAGRTSAWRSFARRAHGVVERYRPRPRHGSDEAGLAGFDAFRIGALRVPLPAGVGRWLAS